MLNELIGAVKTSHRVSCAGGPTPDVLDVFNVLIVVLIGAVRTSHLVLAAGGSMLLLMFVLLGESGAFRMETFADLKFMCVLWKKEECKEKMVIYCR